MKEHLKTQDWKEALKEVAKIVGHKPSTLKNQYLDPDLVKKYEKKAFISIRSLESIAEIISESPQETISPKPISSEPYEVPQPISTYDPSAAIKQVNLSENVENVNKAKVSWGGFAHLQNAWRILAPFLPTNARLENAFRDDLGQAKVMMEYWFSGWPSTKKRFELGKGVFHTYLRHKLNATDKDISAIRYFIHKDVPVERWRKRYRIWDTPIKVAFD
jgi:nitrogen fixation protein